jgi:hypothetical protein
MKTLVNYDFFVICDLLFEIFNSSYETSFPNNMLSGKID